MECVSRWSVTKIRVATDFSPVAAYAVRRGAMLAASRGMPIEVVHVVPSVPPGGSVLGVTTGQLQAAKIRVSQQLAEDVKALDVGKIARSSRLLEGNVADQLIVSDPDASLVVIGFRGRRPLRQRLLGSTAERLVERSPHDVLVVKNNPRGPYRKVLVCTDFNHSTALMFERASAWFPEADMHLLHVYQPPYEGLLETAGAPADAIREHRQASVRTAKQEAARFVSSLSPSLRPRGTSVRRGDAPDVIAEVVASQEYDLVILGRNRTLASELFIGSVTKRVLRASSSDVLVVVGGRDR
jgi:universal stress protein E